MVRLVKSYARYSPASLIRKPFFWLEQKDFLVVIFLAFFILLIFWEYTYGQKDGVTLLFNLLIHSIGILGILNGIKFLAEIRVNTDIVKDIENNGNEYLRNIREGIEERLALDKLESKLLPINNTQPKPAMIRLFQKIIMEAKDRQFESSVSLVQHYQEESYEKILQISNLQKMALRLGILGTFIGLLGAIKNLTSQSLSGEITEIIGDLFSSLYLAFSTSIAGLEVSILLGILLSILYRKQKIYFRLMEDAVITMLSSARNSINKDEFLTEFNQIYSLTNELSNQIYDYNESVKKSVGSAEQKISVLTTQIEQGLKQLSQSKAEFDGFINNLSSTQKQFITEMEHIYDVLSLKRISDELQRSIIGAGSNVSNHVEQTKEKIDIQTEQIQQGIHRLSQTNRELSNFLDEIHQTQEKFITGLRQSYDVASINEVKKALDYNSNQIQKLARVINDNANASLWTRLRKLF